MSVQFLVNGIHPDGTSGLVSITRDEWIKILEDNMTLPKEQRRYFYRDAITDNDTRDYIFMEVPRETFFEWTNQDRATYRNYEAQKQFFVFHPSHLLFKFFDIYYRGFSKTYAFLYPCAAGSPCFSGDFTLQYAHCT